MQPSRSPEARDPKIAEFGRTAGEYFARWHWVLRLLAAMPPPGTPLWREWLGKRANALRGWDTTGTPPECPRCHRLAQVLFVPDAGGSALCSTCWLEANGKTPTSGDWREYAIATAEQHRQDQSSLKPHD